MQIFKKQLKNSKAKILAQLPSSFEIGFGSPSRAIFPSGMSINLGCLGCVHPKCLYFDESELKCTEMGSFSFDNDPNVCAMGAISWDTDLNQPKVDNKKCVLCGACLSRCPVKALYFSKEFELLVTRSVDSADAINSSYLISDTQNQASQIDELLKVKKLGSMLRLADEPLEIAYNKVKELDHRQQNLLIRNILIALGCNSSISRVGDVYTRMDAIYSSASSTFGAVEVEFGKDTLEAFRSILDDVAILNTRYGIEKTVNSPLVICLQLPNKRQGYWHVIHDTMKVLDLKIGTVTFGALLLLLWSNRELAPEDSNYYIDYVNTNIRRIIERQVKPNSIEVSEKFLGILEPEK